jgi:4-amino-4-deoxy-L-arabinose transferase-like glycosyltransferase
MTPSSQALAGDRQADGLGETGSKRSLLRGLVWAFGLAFIPLIAVAATLYLASASGPALEQLWITFPGTDIDWLWASLGIIAALASGLGIALFLSRGKRQNWLLPYGLILLVVTRVAAIGLIHPPMVGDWLNYYQLAQTVAGSGPSLSDVPTGYPILAAVFFRIFGPNVLIGELINLAASVLTGLLVYRLAARLWGRRAAGLALYLYAISVAQLLMVTVFGTEVLFAAAVLAATLIMLEATGRSGRAGLFTALLCGAILGLSQYVRVDAELVLPAFLILPFLLNIPARKAAELAGACLLAFLLVLGPVVAWNVATYGTVSVSTSNFAGWSLLVGTDLQSNGQWNLADVALRPANTNTREFNDKLMSLAIQRLRAHPGRIATLAVRKIIPMWGNENYAAAWTLDATNPDLWQERGEIALTSQVTYVAILAFAAAGIWQERRRRPELLTLIILIVGATAIAHVFLEVQPRYHFFVEPMLCILAGGWLAARFGGESRPPAIESNLGG